MSKPNPSPAAAAAPAIPPAAPDSPVNYVTMEVERYRLKLETSALYDLARKMRDRASKCEEEGDTEIAAGLNLEASKISAEAKGRADALGSLEAQRNRLLRAALNAAPQA